MNNLYNNVLLYEDIIRAKRLEDVHTLYVFSIGAGHPAVDAEHARFHEETSFGN